MDVSSRCVSSCIFLCSYVSWCIVVWMATTSPMYLDRYPIQDVLSNVNYISSMDPEGNRVGTGLSVGGASLTPKTRSQLIVLVDFKYTPVSNLPFLLSISSKVTTRLRFRSESSVVYANNYSCSFLVYCGGR